MATETIEPLEAFSLRRDRRLLLHVHEGPAIPLAPTPRGRARGYPLYTWPETVADLLVHLAGLGAALAYAPVLLLAAADTGVGTSLVAAFYLIGLFGMLAASAAYNFCPIRPLKATLGKLDLVFIYVKILSVYAVFTWAGATGPLGPWTFLLAAIVATVGIALVLADVCLPLVARVATYLAIGWSGAVGAVHLHAALAPDTFALVVAGGLLYTCGVAFYVSEGRLFHHAAWHATVVLASALHALAVLDVLSGPA